MKKLALLHYAYPPKVGGVEVLVKEQTTILSEFGYDVLVLAGSGSEKPNSKVKLVVVEEFQSVNITNPELYDRILIEGEIDKEFYNLASKIGEKLEKYLADRDVIIVHNMLTLYHNMPFIYAFKKYCSLHPEKKIIVWVHDQTYIGFDRIRLKEIKLSDIVHKLLIEKIKNAQYVAISKIVRDLLPEVMDISPNDVLIIPDGKNIKEFLEINDPVWEVVQKYNLLEKFPLILSPVNILSRKNLEYSAEVVFYLKKQYPNIIYIITGKPSEHRKNQGYDDFLKERIKELSLENNAFFLYDILGRYLDPMEIHDFYSLSDIVFHFPKGENFGLPLLEAFFTKTPIFVSDLKVFKEIGGENLMYINVEEKSSQEAAEIVNSFLKENKVINLQHMAKRNYSLKKIIHDKLIPIL